MTARSASLLADLIASPAPSAYALVCRHGPGAAASLEVLTGDLTTPATLGSIPVPSRREPAGLPCHDVLVLIPYRQITERGFACVDDRARLLAITVTGQQRVPLPLALRLLPDEPVTLANERFDVGDHDYAQIVNTVVRDEIGRGEGSNFVIKRSYLADVTGYSPRAALSVFRRLLCGESGSYWTFLVHAEGQTFIGASPERHVSLAAGLAVMNPISGTLRYGPAGPTIESVGRFLADRKEIDELNMVVDEELKMMGRICDGGGRVVGPYLKEMARLAHTEYLIKGHTSADPRVILRETMFAPTVTGSPLENACRVITRYEPSGRGYYGGVAALIGRDEHGGPVLDSAIMIRTAQIAEDGRLSIGVGATLVRHSVATSEVSETAAKAAGLLTAVAGNGPGVPSGVTARAAGRFGAHPDVLTTLARRNDTLAGFWLAPLGERGHADPVLADLTTVIIDAEDTFTAMIAHQLRAIGLRVTVRRYDEPAGLDEHEFVVLGPGPGDPLSRDDPKVASLRVLVRRLLERRRPFLAVCLSHQVLCTELGLPIVRLAVPNQGAQKVIDLFGSTERVGFYNTFAARTASEEIGLAGIGAVRVSRDPVTSDVHALRGPWFASFQFHAESVLTEDGVAIFAAAVKESLGVPRPG